MIVFIVWAVCFLITFSLCISYNKRYTAKFSLLDTVVIASLGIFVLLVVLLWMLYDFLNSSWLRWSSKQDLEVA